ncbi:MAG: hypothetical protein DI551_06415 [Micavibrio aeruginosavorus]|uniref:General stress protein 17M-like domain-containing protein n=1 Tax=Micavibrio aeruginosavorus TaxID=349221 RepID=A0A2W5Q356_9BACT|nr:MAG: hypothetical protein DI551_06415 [Micavibrio aeruginosavorus]
MTDHVTATFKTRVAAEDAVNQLINAGFFQEDISLLVTDTTRGSSFTIKEGDKSDSYEATGAEAGGAFGALTALLISTSVIPTAGLSLVAIGPIAATLVGLGAGGLAGGLIGALVGAGVPEHEAKLYEKDIKAGSILLAVSTDSKEERKLAEKVLKDTDATKVAA